jgi:tetratricopeptide (TPR) repeat protein
LLLSSKLFGTGQIDGGTDMQQGDVQHSMATEWSQQIQHALNLESMGDFAKAERTLVASIHQAEQPGADAQWLPTALDRLGVLNWDLGRTRRAEQFYLRAVGLWRARFGPSSLGLATTLSDLAWVYAGLGDPAHAASLWQQSIEILTVILGLSHPSIAQVYGYLAINAYNVHRLDQAESFCEQALRMYEQSGEIPGETDQVLSSLASVRLRQERPSEAIQLMNEAIDLQRTANHRSARLLGGYFYNLALAEIAAARPADAKAHFERALSLLAAAPYANQTLRCNVLYSYAHFLASVGHKKEAKTVQRQASIVARVIRRDSYAEYAADVSSFR